MNIPSDLSVAFVYKHKMTSEVLVVDIDRARELDAANERIKLLKEAGNALVDYNIGCGCGQDGPCRACRLAIEAWNAAKEDKP